MRILKLIKSRFDRQKLLKKQHIPETKQNMKKFGSQIPTFLLVFIFASSCSALRFGPTGEESPKLVDMSYPFNNVTASPPDPTMWKFERQQVHKGEWDGHGDIWFEINNVKMNEHAGTHIDAPTHFNKDGWDPSEIPLERLYKLPAVVINITERARQDPHAQLLPVDLTNWESRNGKIPKNAAVLVNSEWGLKWGTDEYMAIVRDENDTIIDMRFPSISPAAAQWIVFNRPDVSCVGIDTTSIEYEPGYNYTTHQILLQKNIFAIENAANIHKLPEKGALISVMPIRIEGGSGAAARIIAELEPETCSSNTAAVFKLCYNLIALVILKHLLF